MVCVLPFLTAGCMPNPSLMPPATPGGTVGAGDTLFTRRDVAGALAEWEKFHPASPAEAFELALRQSRAFREAGDERRALLAAEAAVSRAQTLGDERKRVLAAVELGLAQIAVSRTVGARETLAGAGNLAREKQFWNELAQVETGLDLLDRLESHPERALAHYAKAGTLAERANDPLLAASLKVMRLQLTEDKPAARELRTAAVMKVRELPDSARRTFLLLRLARIAQTQLAAEADQAETAALLREAEESGKRLKDDRLSSYPLGYQGGALENQGRYADAEQLTAQAADTMDVLERYIGAGKFRDKPVELLTLSACQTAAGDGRAALGLAGVAVKAGARSALASLWFINDQASSDLVTQFYENLKNPVSKVEALRQAQIKLLKGPRHRHASYWAPFLMIGNWL